MADKKLTDTQRRILRNLRDHPDLEALSGFHGMAQRGGATRSLYKLLDQGLVEWIGQNLGLTEAGKQALADAEAPTQ